MKNLFLAVFLFFAVVAGSAQNQANLKLNPEKNKVYRFRTTSEQSISQTINGIQQNTGIDNYAVTSFKMVDATPEFLIAEIRFDTIITKVNAMGNINTFNSVSKGNMGSEDINEVMACVLNRLSNNALFTKMDYTGKVIEIINAEMLYGIIMKDADSIKGQTAPMIRTQIENMVSKDALKTMAESLTNYLPGKQVGSGEKWQVTSTTSSGGMAFEVITGYNLNSINGNSAIITAESDIKPASGAKPIDYGAAQVTYYEVKGLSKSKLIVDTTTGLIIENTSKNSISGDLDVNVQGNNMQIPMVMSGESKTVAF